MVDSRASLVRTSLAVHGVNNRALVAFKAFLGFACRFLRGGLRFFLLSQFALDVDDLPAVGVSFPIVLANLVAQCRASGFLTSSS